MKCVDCELHDYIVGTHFCNYKGKSGRRRPRRISEEDAHKDVPCECVGEREGADEGYKDGVKDAMQKIADSILSEVADDEDN